MRLSFTHQPSGLFAKTTVVCFDGLGECTLVQKIVGRWCPWYTIGQLIRYGSVQCLPSVHILIVFYSWAIPLPLRYSTVVLRYTFRSFAFWRSKRANICWRTFLQFELNEKWLFGQSVSGWHDSGDWRKKDIGPWWSRGAWYWHRYRKIGFICCCCWNKSSKGMLNGSLGL